MEQILKTIRYLWVPLFPDIPSEKHQEYLTFLIIIFLVFLCVLILSESQSRLL